MVDTPLPIVHQHELPTSRPQPIWDVLCVVGADPRIGAGNVVTSHVRQIDSHDLSPPLGRRQSARADG